MACCPVNGIGKKEGEKKIKTKISHQPGQIQAYMIG